MSSGGGSSTNTTRVQYSPQEQAARDTIAGGAQGLFNTLWTRPVNNDTIAKPVGPSAGTRQSWDIGQSVMSAMMSGANSAQNTNNALVGESQQFNDGGTDSAVARSNTQLLNATDVNNNPALAGAIKAAQRPVVEQFTGAGGVLSNIRNNGVTSGTFGGSRQGIAEGLAMQGLQRQLGDISSTMGNQAYNAGLQAQTAATNNLMETQIARLGLGNDAVKNQAMINMMRTAPMEIASGIGRQQEGFQQLQNNYNADVAGNWENQRYRQLQNFGNVIYGGSNGTTTSTSSAPKTDHTGQILGSAATLGMMALMMSDKRLKSNIKRIGTHAKGFGIYLYKIFGGWQVGVLAQEVKKIVPAAVHRHPSGYYMVNYSVL